VRNALVAALISCADNPAEARRFLLGLSSDELQFIAEFVGARTLESARKGLCSRAQLAEDIAQFQRARGCAGRQREDQEHKMILLLEYLCRGGGGQLPAARAAHA
jgi:hypothetical protein